MTVSGQPLIQPWIGQGIAEPLQCATEASEVSHSSWLVDLRFARALSLVDGHGDELLRMARLITGSAEVARPIVAAALLAADTQASGIPLTVMATRRALASSVFAACWPTSAAGGSGVALPSNCAPHEPIAGESRTSAARRAALALHLYSGFTMAEVGALLGTTTHSACLMVLAASEELAHLSPEADPLHAGLLGPRTSSTEII